MSKIAELDEELPPEQKSSDNLNGRSVLLGRRTQSAPIPTTTTISMPPRPSLQGRLSTRGANWNIPTNVGAQEHVDEVHGKDSWRYKVLAFLHTKKVQRTLLLLLLLDVIILFTELFLLAAYPSCRTIQRDAVSCCPVESNHAENDEQHRWLASTGHDDICSDMNAEPNYDNEAGCDPHKWHNVHTAENALFICTIVILSIFFIELNITMAALTPKIFFLQFFYALDYVVVTVSLVFEILLKTLSEETLQTVFGLLIIARLWRFVRIGHGIVEVVVEVSHEKYQDLLAYTEELEEILKENNIEIPDTESIRKIKDDSATIVAEIEREHRKSHIRKHGHFASHVKDRLHHHSGQGDVGQEDQDTAAGGIQDQVNASLASGGPDIEKSAS